MECVSVCARACVCVYGCAGVGVRACARLVRGPRVCTGGDWGHLTRVCLGKSLQMAAVP